MTTLLVAMEDRVLTVGIPQGETVESLRGKEPTCIAVDPHRPTRAYVGTADDGIWRSDDGESWEAAGRALRERFVTALAVSPLERGDGVGVVYAGTEPSVMYRSEDGGDTWRDLPGFPDLPSSSTWSFPPRPETHHVRWIAIDPLSPGRVYVAVEAGALVQTPDGGRTWRDRTPRSPYDTHTLAIHPRAPGRLYSAAGDGYFESHDAGGTWLRPRAGLDHHYLFGVTVHPADPDTVLVSASEGPWSAYNARNAESVVYRRAGGGRWQPVTEGLPEPAGTTVATLVASQAEPGVVYAANNRGLFVSRNFGDSWERLQISWPRAGRRQHVEGLALIEGN